MAPFVPNSSRPAMNVMISSCIVALALFATALVVTASPIAKNKNWNNVTEKSEGLKTLREMWPDFHFPEPKPEPKLILTDEIKENLRQLFNAQNSALQDYASEFQILTEQFNEQCEHGDFNDAILEYTQKMDQLNARSLWKAKSMMQAHGKKLGLPKPVIDDIENSLNLVGEIIGTNDTFVN